MKLERHTLTVDSVVLAVLVKAYLLVATVLDLTHHLLERLLHLLLALLLGRLGFVNHDIRLLYLQV